jgi:electron transfer flavoprotein beta subunit
MEKSRNLPVQKLMFDENMVPPKAVRTRIGPPRPRPKAPSPPDSELNAHDRIKELLTGSRLEKKGEMLTGSLSSQVDGFISFLELNDFLNGTRKEPEG